MKKLVFLVLLVMTVLCGCSSGTNAVVNQNEGFTKMNIKFVFNEDTYDVVVDLKTNNVYLSAGRPYGNDTFSLFNENGEIMKFDSSLLGGGKKTRFVTLNEYYVIHGDKYYVIKDTETNNLYLSAARPYGNDTMPFFDDNGKIKKSS